MLVDGFDVKKEYRAFSKKKQLDFHMGNQVLYDMCEKYPHHDNTDIIVSKIWLIGRSYAAAIERRPKSQSSKPEDNSDDFYYDVVAKIIKKKAKRIDKLLDALKAADGDYKDNAEQVLKLHAYVVDVFYEISKLKKHSLAAKYLHFHCPDKILIYDSRARNAIRKIVQRPQYRFDGYDNEYADFYARVLELTDAIEATGEKRPDPRTIDNFLLHHIESLNLSRSK